MTVEVLDVSRWPASASSWPATSASRTTAALKDTTALLVDETGTSETGVVMVHGPKRPTFGGMDTSGPLVHRFMSSTLNSGTLSGWTVLEAQWSPITSMATSRWLQTGPRCAMACSFALPTAWPSTSGGLTLLPPPARTWSRCPLGGDLVDGDVETDVTLRGARVLGQSRFPPSWHGGGRDDLHDACSSSGADALIEVLQAPKAR